MSQFIKELTKPSDPFYLRLIKGSNVTMPEFSNRGVFYTESLGFGGNVASNTTNPLIDVRDYIYTSGTTSNLDFWGYTFDVPTGVKGKDVAFNFNYKTSTSNFVVVVYALCTSGNRQIDISTPITIGTSQYQRVFTVPADCTGLKIGWQYTGTASGETFEYDNIVFSQWTPQAVNLVEQESIVFNGASAGAVSTLVNFTSVDSFLSNYSNILSYVNDGSSGTKVIVKKKSVVTINVGLLSNGVSAYFPTIFKNGSLVIYGSQSTNLNYASINSITLPANSGDYFQIYNQQAGNVAGYGIFSVTATAISENIQKTWEPSDRIGETIYLPQNVAPRGFISAMGSVIGKTTGTYQGDTYYNLYKVLWNVALNTAGQPYYISAAKGADALTDWNAGKTITIDESGLFTRAFKSGVTNGVGQKQDDALQNITGSSSRLSNVGITDGNARVTGAFYAGSAVSGYNDTANAAAGTLYELSFDASRVARTAAETRPINVAKYVFIRYATSEPVVLALPAATQTDYYIEAAGNAGQSITSGTTNIPFIATTQKNASFDGTYFTAPLDGVYKISGGVYFTTGLTNTVIQAYVNDSFKRILSYHAGTWQLHLFTGEVYLYQGQKLSIRSDTSGTLSNNTSWHFLTIARLNGKNDGVFVGNVQPEWQYDLTVTGMNWTTARAVGVVYKMASGQYRMKGNITGTVSVGNLGSLTVSGAIFKSGVNQTASLISTTNGVVYGCYFSGGTTSIIQLSTVPSTASNVSITYDVELESKPTWATQTP